MFMQQPQQVSAMQHFDEHPLAANEYTCHFEPDRFVLDFKNITPQFPPGGAPLQLMVGHKVITLDPFLAKMLAQQLTGAVTQYEQNFGEIVQSPAQAKAREQAEKSMTMTKSEKPSYMG